MTWKTTELLALLGLATACSDLPEILPDRCGNGLVEAGERCDPNAPLGEVASGQLRCGEPNTFGACHWLCLATDQAPACPEGWTCGADGLCVYPDGRYEESLESPTLLPERPTIRLVDLDGDGRVDLLSQDRQGRVDVRFRTRPGAFGEPLALRPEPRVRYAAGAISTGSVAGVPGVALLEDGQLELSRVGRSRQLEAVVVPRVVLGGPLGASAVTPIAWNCPSGPRVIAAAATTLGVRFFLAPEDPAAAPLELSLRGAVLPGDLAGAAALPARIPVGYFGVGPVIALAPPGGRAVYLLRLTGCGEEDALEVWRTLRLPAGFVVRKDPGQAPRVHVVDEGGEGAMDVLVSAEDSAKTPRVFIARAPEGGDTSFEPYPELEPGGPADPWPVLRADFNADGLLDGATAAGVFVTEQDGQGHALQRWISMPPTLTTIAEAIVLSLRPGPADVLYTLAEASILTRVRNTTTATPTVEIFGAAIQPQGLTVHPGSSNETPIYIYDAQSGGGHELECATGFGPEATVKRWRLSFKELRLSMERGLLWVATMPFAGAPSARLSYFDALGADLRPFLPRVGRPLRAVLLAPPDPDGFQVATVSTDTVVQLVSSDAARGIDAVLQTALPPEIARDPAFGRFGGEQEDLYALDGQGGLTILRLPSGSAPAKVFRGRIGLAGRILSQLGDLDGNGKTELLFVERDVLNIVWNLQLVEDGSIQFERASIVGPLPPNFGDLALSGTGLGGRRGLIWPSAKLNNDGPPEARAELGSYSWSDETLVPGPTFFSSRTSELRMSLAVGDLDGDHLLDVAMVLDGALHVFLAQRGGL